MTAEPVTVTKQSFLVPFSFELLIDGGFADQPGTLGEMLRTWQKEQDAEREAMWRALPWYVRFYRRHFLPWRWDWQERIAHASRALRGIECERDDG